MAHILTNDEAANVLRCETTDSLMLDLLPAVDAYIETATARDWSADATVHPTAKAAAQILLAQWHEDPGMAGGAVIMSGGLQACLAQLGAEALYYYTFEGLNGTGSIYIPAAREGDTVSSVSGRVGVTGDQSAKFENVITVDGYIQQTSAENLEDKWFRVKLVPAAEI